MTLKLPRGTIQAKLEFEELAAARYYKIVPYEWDSLHIEERLRLMAAFRDVSDLESISLLSKEDRDSLRATGEWVILDKGNGHG